MSPRLERVDWGCDGALAVNVDQAIQLLDAWTYRSVRKIFQMLIEFAAASEAVRFDMPTYRVGDNCLILDGSHRTLALCMLRKSISVSALVIEGPLDRKVLPDLKHFGG